MDPIDTDAYRLPSDTSVDLSAWPTTREGAFDGRKQDGLERIDEQGEHLLERQQLLYADGRHKVLVVLQGMDTSGKDGTIKHVFKSVNPLGVRVANFKRPNDVELSHDYLWRVHHNAPRNGEIVIFNRSHYEDVLVTRVHDLAPQEVWRRRYDQIRDFERMLVEEGTVIRKFFLHISKDTQRERLQERLDNPTKHWKFEHGDIEERKYWDQYTAAYEEALARTSTTDAPWYAVPSDTKWFRNLVVSTILCQTLDGLDLRYPDPSPDLDKIKID